MSENNDLWTITNPYEIWGFRIFFSLVGCFFIVLIIFMILSNIGDDTKILKVINIDAGVVKEIRNCSKSKYSYNCRVITDKWDMGTLDVSDVHGDTLLEKGERLFIVEKITERRYKKMICVRGYCPYYVDHALWYTDEYKQKHSELLK